MNLLVEMKDYIQNLRLYVSLFTKQTIERKSIRNYYGSRRDRKGIHYGTSSCELIGMNATLMKQYIEYVADRLLKMLGSLIPNIINWRIHLIGWNLWFKEKRIFFEKRVGEYSNKANPNVQTNQVFILDSDFLMKEFTYT